MEPYDVQSRESVNKNHLPCVAKKRMQKNNSEASQVDMFIVYHAVIKAKGLQALVQILYQILDKTRNVVL